MNFLFQNARFPAQNPTPSWFCWSKLSLKERQYWVQGFFTGDHGGVRMGRYIVHRGRKLISESRSCNFPVSPFYSLDADFDIKIKIFNEFRNNFCLECILGGPPPLPQYFSKEGPKNSVWNPRWWFSSPQSVNFCRSSWPQPWTKSQGAKFFFFRGWIHQTCPWIVEFCWIPIFSGLRNHPRVFWGQRNQQN